MQVALTDHADSPFENVAHHEVQHRVEEELRKVPEPYRTTLILRDLEEMSYEEIAEVLQISLGTVKSRLTRGREALRQEQKPLRLIHLQLFICQVHSKPRSLFTKRAFRRDALSASWAYSVRPCEMADYSVPSSG